MVFKLPLGSCKTSFIFPFFSLFWFSQEFKFFPKLLFSGRHFDEPINPMATIDDLQSPINGFPKAYIKYVEFSSNHFKFMESFHRLKHLSSGFLRFIPAYNSIHRWEYISYKDIIPQKREFSFIIESFSLKVAVRN